MTIMGGQPKTPIVQSIVYGFRPFFSLKKGRILVHDSKFSTRNHELSLLRATKIASFMNVTLYLLLFFFKVEYIFTNATTILLPINKDVTTTFKKLYAKEFFDAMLKECQGNTSCENVSKYLDSKFDQACAVVVIKMAWEKITNERLTDGSFFFPIQFLIFFSQNEKALFTFLGCSLSNLFLCNYTVMWILSYFRWWFRTF